MNLTRPTLSAVALLGLSSLAVPARSHAQPAPLLVKDLYPGGQYDRKYGFSPYSSDPHLFTRVQDRLVFLAGSEAGLGLWRSDGTADGTRLLGSSRTGSEQLMRVSNVAVLPFEGDSAHGNELWKTDGTEEGTVLLKDIAPGGAGSAPVLLAQQCERIFLSAHVGEQWELWKTDGTEEGTVRVRDLPGPVSKVVRSGATLFLIVAERELWRTDGSEEGTFLLRAFPQPLRELTAGATRVYFSTLAQGDASELWTSDGTTTGTSLVRYLPPDSFPGHPQLLATAGDRLYFSEELPATGRELWVTDGTEAGSFLFRDLLPGPASSVPHDALTLPNGRVLFWTYKDNYGRQVLWGTDGSEPGTQALRELSPDWRGFRPVSVGDQTFLASAETPSGYPIRLWRTDGTEPGTAAIGDFGFTRVGREVEGRLIFESGQTLWISEGTRESTRALVLPLDKGTTYAPTEIGFVDETTVLFPATTSENGSELFGAKVEPLALSPVAACVKPGEPEPQPSPHACGCATGTSAAVLPGVLGLLLALRGRGRRGPGDETLAG